MNARKAKREACGIAAGQISAYLEAGQPHEDAERYGNMTEADADRIADALKELRLELERRA